MPELPEVETIKLQLEKYIVGSVIKDIEIRNPKYEIRDKSKIINSKIICVRRFAKQLSIDLANKYSIMIHVKMTGQLIYQGSRLKDKDISKKVTGGLGGKHTHLIFHLNDGDLYYNDVRRFGWIKVVTSDKVTSDKQAPEPLKDLMFEIFSRIVSSSRRNVKVLLMDQSKIGGIGNIYANDALWLSRISPRRSASSLSISETRELHNAIETVLKAGLKYGGASELAFVTPDGKEGEYQNHTLVYGHQNEICKNCKKENMRSNSVIEKFFLGGRGTYWCKICQK